MARTPEQRSWDTFSAAIDRRKIWAQRVENMALNSMPDVVCTNRRGAVFWIENKAINGWPSRDSTTPLRNAFQPGQLAWARQWKEWSGNSFVLLRVGLEYYLLDPADNLQVMTKYDIIGHAIEQGKKEIIEYLENLTNEDAGDEAAADRT